MTRPCGTASSGGVHRSCSEFPNNCPPVKGRAEQPPGLPRLRTVRLRLKVPRPLAKSWGTLGPRPFSWSSTVSILKPVSCVLCPGAWGLGPGAAMSGPPVGGGGEQKPAAASETMRGEGYARVMNRPMAAFSRPTVPRRSRTVSGFTFPLLTETLICFGLGHYPGPGRPPSRLTDDRPENRTSKTGNSKCVFAEKEVPSNNTSLLDA
jgi:hypothetical protein